MNLTFLGALWLAECEWDDLDAGFGAGTGAAATLADAITTEGEGG